jgi:hypothetical protein
MKKNILPLLLIAGAAIAFMVYRRRGKVSVEAGPTEIITEQDFAAPVDISKKPSPLDIGTKLISQLFTKKAGVQAQRTAVKRAVRTKTATKKQAKAVTKQLSKGIRFAGFDDNVLI